jgi:hypothetical protein
MGRFEVSTTSFSNSIPNFLNYLTEIITKISIDIVEKINID